MQSFPIRESKCARKLFALVKVSARENIIDITIKVHNTLKSG